MRLIAVLLSILLASPASAGQMSLLGAGGAVGAAGYVGPGDVISGADFYFGLDCYNAAYTGNVADVYAPSDASHTLLTCTNGTINQTIQSLATTCAISCTIKTLYDQSGANRCNSSASPCDVTQSVEAKRPTLTISGINGKLSANCSVGGGKTLVSSTSLATRAQPFTQMAVFQRTATGIGVLMGTIGGSGTGLAGWTAADQFAVSAGNFVQINSITDNVAHGVQFISVNPASGSVAIIDGASTSTPGVGTMSQSGTIAICDDTFTDLWIGQFTSLGSWPIAFSGTQQTNMCNNRKTTYALGGSC